MTEWSDVRALTDVDYWHGDFNSCWDPGIHCVHSIDAEGVSASLYGLRVVWSVVLILRLVALVWEIWGSFHEAQVQV